MFKDLKLLPACALPLIAACVAHGQSLRNESTEALWESTRHDDAFLDLRCKGLSGQEANDRLSEFTLVEQKLKTILGRRKWEGVELIPVHMGCPHYDGAFRRYVWHMNELSRRLFETAP